ncbi:hypothetical protein DVA67_027905 [Solirubrobacter sp. CPCC 204708]|uniref:DUF1453 domain-containing protein n=1 Tax=Solirubrobacter deserti TaxID=2282478 RepID=A0ABT4RJG5_9ACTN|nr:hypothetical protein [Solirubrobacter deserti]MBE2319821.1 hypothetical protein [Solirubrobacter deserti]MDA0138698.1 hypothetical protein [Solirubrobacter deserti]
MTVLAILLIVLPWSIWRQMHARPVTVEGLVKLPLIFAVVAAVFALTSKPSEVTAAVIAYNAACAVLAIGFGAWRGQRLSIWDVDGTPMQRGNRVTMTTWVLMIALKIALGTVASVTGWIPAEGAGAILAFLALTFAIQNLVVARRTVWAPGSREIRATT